ncbi:MAG: flagellar type III secretion system pore protein FliP [Clostridia bacterium]
MNNEIGLLLGLTALALLPTLVLTLTAFPRIIVVLSLLRTALGLQTTPPNAVLVGIALILTGIIMGPLLTTTWHTAITPALNGHTTWVTALRQAQGPWRTWLIGQTRPQDLAFFLRLTGAKPGTSVHAVPFLTLSGAFLISQMQLAFEIGIFLYLPFVVIDLVVSTILMSLGMIMVPPTLISLPIKLLLFVLANGWVLVIQSLVQSFH